MDHQWIVMTVRDRWPGIGDQRLYVHLTKFDMNEMAKPYSGLLLEVEKKEKMEKNNVRTDQVRNGPIGQVILFMDADIVTCA
ncbi:hypothetical protein JCGZ_12769 [Jatropha curcas]|uniref:Uncharacterized protein n=1 Tax=Jatropha curcas TaxID=180498 RepID=A0A067KE22_JATCU|nr:hypothetical protein JCGZ_12769 [Jatropha curcas]